MLLTFNSSFTIGNMTKGYIVDKFIEGGLHLTTLLIIKFNLESG